MAIDFPDQPFVITQPKKSEIFGNPQIDPVPREKVAAVLRRLLQQALRGEPRPHHQRLLDGAVARQVRHRQASTPSAPTKCRRTSGNTASTTIRSHASATPRPTAARRTAAWTRTPTRFGGRTRATTSSANYAGPTARCCGIYAGYDETGVWQEFGEMKFKTKDDIPPEWGNPNPDKPRWVPTRYVEWTSWLAGAQQWGVSSIRQGENSGTITHELGHFAFSIGDLNNNPYVDAVSPRRGGAVGHDGPRLVQRPRRAAQPLGGAADAGRFDARAAHAAQPDEERFRQQRGGVALEPRRPREVRPGGGGRHRPRSVAPGSERPGRRHRPAGRRSAPRPHAAG